MKILTDVSVTSRALQPKVVWTPDWIFRSGVQGAWYDPSDISTLFQDAEGTAPVFADGDPVALMRDKSGNGNDALQSSATQRPTWRSDGELAWLEFDGVDDRMECGPTAFDSSAFLTCCAGMSYMPGGSGWGALRSRVDAIIYAGLSHPSTAGAITLAGGQFFIDGTPAPNGRTALRAALLAPRVFEARDVQVSNFSGSLWQFFSHWNASPPGGKLFGYVEHEGGAGPGLDHLRRWMAEKTGSMQ